jgi:flagellar biogenesis protein FliO
MAIEKVDPTGLAPSGYLWSLLQMLAALVVVCALAYLLLRGLRALAGPRPSGGAVRVVERCSLSSRHSLWVVEVGDRCFLLGCSEPGGPITRVAELDRATLDSLGTRAAKPANKFLDILAKLSAQPGGDGRPPERL